MPIKEIEFGQRNAKMEFLVFRNLMKRSTWTDISWYELYAIKCKLCDVKD